MPNYLIMTLGPGSSPDPNIYYRTKNHRAVESICNQLRGYLLELCFCFGIWSTDGDVCIASLLFGTAAEVIVAAVDGTGPAFALHIVVAVLGFNFVTAEVAAYCVFDNHVDAPFKM